MSVRRVANGLLASGVGVRVLALSVNLSRPTLFHTNRSDSSSMR